MKHNRTLLTGRVGSGKTTLVLSVSAGEPTVLVSADPLPYRPEDMDVTVLRRGAPGFVVAKTLEKAAGRARETGSTLVIDGLVPVRVPEIGGAPIRPVVDSGRALGDPGGAGHRHRLQAVARSALPGPDGVQGRQHRRGPRAGQVGIPRR